MRFFKRASSKKKSEPEAFEILILEKEQDFKPLEISDILKLKVNDRYFERDRGAIGLCEIVKPAQKDDNDCWSWEIKFLGTPQKDENDRFIVKVPINNKAFSVGFREGFAHHFNFYHYVS